MRKKDIRGLSGIVILLLSVFAGAKGIESYREHDSEKEHPGYFEQWFNEKKGPDGTIPSWRYARWADWDKSQMNRRSNEKIFDTIFPLGPANVGGRTRSIWIDPRNDNFILAAAISGGVWRSENGGTSWKPLNEHQESLIASCFTHNPKNPDIVYYGTGESRANSADVNGGGVFKSTDGGKTFSRIPSTVGRAGFDAIWDIEHLPDDSNTLFVGTHGQGLHRSTDGGNTWERLTTGGNNLANDILALPGGRVLVSMQSNQVYASDSAGKSGTFRLVSFPTFPASGTYGRIQMANCRNFPNVVYAVFEGIGFNDPPVRFYKSSNGGRTWIQRTAPSQFGPSYQTYCLMLGVSATDSNVVVGGGVNIAQSNNGGTSWTNKTQSHADYHYMIPFYKNNTDFLVGNDGGVYRYKYGSSSVNADLNNGYYTTQFYAGAFGPTGNVSIGGTQDNGTHVATNRLNTRKFYGADGAYAHIGLQDGTVAYLSTQNEGIRRIDNFNPNVPPSFTTGIAASAFSSEGVNFINAYTMAPGDQNTLVYRTNQGVHLTKDGGASWTRLNTINRSSIKALAISNESNPVLYFGGGAAQLYRMDTLYTAAKGSEVSYNASVPFQVTDDFLNSIIIHPKDRYTIYVSFSNINNQPRVWRVTGMNTASPKWTSVSGNLPPSLPVNMVAMDPAFPDKNLFAATDFGFYYSTDSGKTWTKEMKVPNVAVHEVKVREDRTVFLYTHGRGLWAMKLSTPSSTAMPAVFSGIRLYPNPAADQIRLQFEQDLKAYNWTIYNQGGQAVLSGNRESAERGIGVTKLAPGTYFIRIQAGERRYTSKFLIQR